MTAARRTQTRAALEEWHDKAVNRTSTPVRELAALLGKLNFLRLQFPEASLHMKRMDELKMGITQRRGWTAECRPHPGLLGEIKWWMQKVTQNTPARFQPPRQEATITTDASPHGWGALYQDNDEEEGVRTFGFWSK
jgi:hypothetical protein